MKAILEVRTGTDEKGASKYEMMLFDTEKAKKICGRKNIFNYEFETYYLSERRIIFAVNNNTKKLSVPDQKKTREFIGSEYPDIYIKFFGEVQEA